MYGDNAGLAAFFLTLLFTRQGVIIIFMTNRNKIGLGFSFLDIVNQNNMLFVI